MKKIRQIICCCGSGLGSSLFVELNLKNIMSTNNIKGIQICHDSITSINPSPFGSDLVVGGVDVAPVLKQYPRVIILKDLISYEEAESKLKRALASEEDSFFIE